jgi:hypothetical protein
MIPTNQQINELAATACGWEPIPEEEDGWTNGREKRWPRPPDYCTDRNALPELWAKVESRPACGQYAGILRDLLRDGNDWQVIRFELITASPLLHTIAALKALNQWPDDWELPEVTK